VGAQRGEGEYLVRNPDDRDLLVRYRDENWFELLQIDQSREPLHKSPPRRATNCMVCVHNIAVWCAWSTVTFQAKLPVCEAGASVAM
jgi:hypothetical protein